VSLIESFAGDWKPEKYEDTYHDELMKVIRAKQKGKEIHHVAEAEEEAPPDLMEALRLSLERSSRGTRKRSTAKRSSAKRRPSRARSR
jgi:DNA end-binding protein Ku